jgi:hypothetical protein
MPTAISVTFGVVQLMRNSFEVRIVKAEAKRRFRYFPPIEKA